MLNLKLIDRVKLLQIQQFALEQAEKIFDHRIVETVGFSTHALPNTLFLSFCWLLVSLVLILPALIRMQDQIGVIRNPCECLCKHIYRHTQGRPVRNRVATAIPF